ncbi:MAG: rod shape-determining protein MreC [Bacteroidales bacterium]|nr:rod shape-determining protein MreC [Bacteroidales bacterium]MBD5282373.1 rod shape-determining protein MreC [Bacteroides sp.]MDE6032750.1 rod shape-determining protein MreC [Muribaculaceae bacterium]MBD5343120.1 rod shape-determining protein MreC [Bacteroides sp.]MBD5352546.1 rod shape-determining protein MreC [Bacteroides sp.]
MRQLVDFFVRHGAWFVFILLVGVSCLMLFRGNPYQQAVYMTSAGAVSSSVYGAANSVTGYFNLRTINDDLQERLSSLEMENLALHRRLQRAEELAYADTVTPDSALTPYRFITARVINNSIAHSNNFITINRGSDDGVMPEMGVIDRNGIVGIVNVTGRHTARVISMLNSDLRLSCKVKGSDAFGSLVWDGKSPRFAVLEELPRHVEFAIGDTVITSGYSVVFPEGIPVGIVRERQRDADDNFYSLRVELLTDFSTLSTVRVIENFLKDEIEEVETDQVNSSGKF